MGRSERTVAEGKDTDMEAGLLGSIDAAGASFSRGAGGVLLGVWVGAVAGWAGPRLEHPPMHTPPTD